MKTVLLADDQVEILEIIETLLAGFGDEIRVRTALDGREAIRRLEEEPVDLIVTDLTMPVVDGFQLLAHVMRHRPSIPVIVMTAFGSPTTRSRVSALGPLIYVESRSIDLVEKIRTALAESATGHLEGVTLASFLQLLHLEKKTCSVRITSKEGDGLLRLDSGELVHAQCGDRRGITAAFQILGWEDVTIQLDAGARLGERTIDRSLEYVLLAAAELRDEVAWKNAREQHAEDTIAAVTEAVDVAFSRLVLEFTSRPAGVQSLLRAVSETLKWRAAVLWTKPEGRDRLLGEAYWGPSGRQEAFEMEREIDLALGTELAARAWKLQRATASVSADCAPARGGFISAAAFPVSTGDRMIGVIELLDESPHEIDREAADWLTALGAMLGGLIEHVRADQRRGDLIGREREALNRIYAREAKQSFLSEASEILSCSLDESVLWGAFVRLVVPRLAEWCVLDIVESNGESRRALVVHHDPLMLEWTEELRLRGSPSPDAWSPLSRVLRTGVPEISRESGLDRSTAILARLGFHSAMIVPLSARNRVLGAVTMVSADPSRPLDPETLETAADIAHRVALAVDNARRAATRVSAPRAGISPEARSIVAG
jgi:CheY-like chemotaxis protein/GAF domain-containing protein